MKPTGWNAPAPHEMRAPDWDTPPGGDFAAYVERLNRAAAASVMPAVPAVPAKTPVKAPARPRAKPRAQAPARRSWSMAALGAVGWLVGKALLLVLAFVPLGGLLTAILTGQTRPSPQPEETGALTIVLSSLILATVASVLMGPWGLLIGLLVCVAWLLWRYRHTRFVKQLVENARRFFADPPDPV